MPGAVWGHGKFLKPPAGHVRGPRESAKSSDPCDRVIVGDGVEDDDDVYMALLKEIFRDGELEDEQDNESEGQNVDPDYVSCDEDFSSEEDAPPDIVHIQCFS